MKKNLIMMAVLVLIFSIGTVAFAYGDFYMEHGVINRDDEICDIEIATPYFGGFNGADELNYWVRNLIIDAIGEGNAMGIELQKFEKTPALDIFYDYSREGDLLSLKLTTYSYYGGAHGNTVIDTITMNTSTGEVYSFGDLFVDESEGIKVAEEFILDAIAEEPDLYFENCKETIAGKHGDFDFYFYGDELIVYFGQYDIAPYAGGVRYFRINTGDLGDLLKDEIYSWVKDSQKRGNLSFNGSHVNGEYKVIENVDGQFLIPLRAVAEILGYEVAWNEKDGAIIEGGFIKEGVDSYWKTGLDPVTLSAPLVMDGATYVPVDYFIDVLGENVKLDSFNDGNLMIRIFGRDGFENNFDRLVWEFAFPWSAESAIEMYAEAVETRNGGIQYGLLSEKLRESTYDYFKDLGFVTGTSSPWVDGYEIERIGDDKFEIVFTLRTSAPEDLLKEVTVIRVDEFGEFWRIVDID